MKKLIVISYLLIALIQMSCKDEEKDGSELGSLDDYVSQLVDPDQPMVTDGKQQVGEVEKEIDNVTKTYCTTVTYKAGEEYNEMMLMDPTSNVIYPGSIIEGNSVIDGSYRQIVLDRAPMKISTDLQNFDGDCAAVVENPSLSSVRSVIKSMIYDANINGSTGAKVNYSIEQIESEEQLNLAIGAGVSMKKAKLNEKFDFSSGSKTSKFLVKYQQIYYTIDVDAPSSPSGFFASNVTSSDLKNAIGGGNAVPVYVSSVKYGRIAYMTVESTQSADSVRNAISASLSYMGVTADVKNTIEKKQHTSSYLCSCYVIGGSGNDAAKTFGLGQETFASLVEYISKGGNFTKESPGQPIAFTLTRLSNNEVFNVVNATEYKVRKCQSTNQSITPVSFYGEKGENDVCGTITIRLLQNGVLSDPFYVFNQPISREALSVLQGKKVDVPAPDQEMPFSIDYTNIEDAKIILDAQLYEWDDPCSCGGKHEFDTYEPCHQEYLLTDLKANDGVGYAMIHLSEEYTDGHYKYKKTGKHKYAHKPHTTPTDCSVKFEFNVMFYGK